MNGEVIVVAGSNDPLELTAIQFLNGRRTLRGWTAGQAKDSEDTIHFSILTDVHPRIEVFPLEQATEAFERMMTSKVRFRAVLTMSSEPV